MTFYLIISSFYLIIITYLELFFSLLPNQGFIILSLFFFFSTPAEMGFHIFENNASPEPVIR